MTRCEKSKTSRLFIQIIVTNEILTFHDNSVQQLHCLYYQECIFYYASYHQTYKCHQVDDFHFDTPTFHHWCPTNCGSCASCSFVTSSLSWRCLYQDHVLKDKLLHPELCHHSFKKQIWFVFNYWLNSTELCSYLLAIALLINRSIFSLRTNTFKLTSIFYASNWCDIDRIGTYLGRMRMRRRAVVPCLIAAIGCYS